MSFNTTANHPTNRPNYVEITHHTDRHAITIAYSYATPIGFQASAYANGRSFVRVNDWGPTTGRHLNEWHPNHSKHHRIPGDEFLRHLSDAMQATFAPAPAEVAR